MHGRGGVRFASRCAARAVFVAVLRCRVLAGRHMERRRSDWRLGRWTAKAAVGMWLSVSPERVEIFAAPDSARQEGTYWHDRARGVN